MVGAAVWFCSGDKPYSLCVDNVVSDPPDDAGAASRAGGRRIKGTILE